jgi:hypothetical protein
MVHRQGVRRVVAFRADDNGWGAKLNAFIQRNAGVFVVLTPLISVIVAIGVMLGFSTVTPQVNFARLDKKDSLLMERIDSTNAALVRHTEDETRARVELRGYVESLVIGQCITRTDEELMKMRLMRFCAGERGK